MGSAAIWGCTGAEGPPASTTGTARGLGTATLVGTGDCGDQPLYLAGPYDCAVVEIGGCGTAERTVYLRRTGPMGAESVGTVILGTGGAMDTFYETEAGEGGAAAWLVQALNDAGYSTIQRAWWRSEDGTEDVWNGADSGHAEDVFCRYATLVQAIHDDTLCLDGACLGWHDGTRADDRLCLTGASGGSSEIGAALAHHGLDAIVDLAVLTGATPFGRMDHPCMADDGRVTLEGWDWPTYLATCEAAFRGYGVLDDDAYWEGAEGEEHCLYTGRQREDRINAAFGDPGPEAGPCPVPGFPELYDPLTLAMASVAATDGTELLFDHDHPTTAIAFVIGNENDGPDVVSGKPYFDAVLARNPGSSVLHTVAGADGAPVGHNVHEHQAGAELILAHLLGTPLDPTRYTLVHASDPGIEEGLGCIDRDGVP